MNVNGGRMNSLPRRKAGASLGALAFVAMAAAACGSGAETGIAPGAADLSSSEIPKSTAPTHTTVPVTTAAEGGAAGADFEPEPETGPEQAITGGGSVPVAPPLPDDDIGAGKQFAAAAASVEFDAEAFARITPGGPRDVDPRRFRQTSNHAGGTEGGMSNGQPIITNVAIKPIATMTKPLPSVDINTGEVVEAAYNRSDICQVARVCPIGEAMMALVLAEAMLEKFGGDSLGEMKRNYAGYIESHQEFGKGPNRGS